MQQGHRGLVAGSRRLAGVGGDGVGGARELRQFLRRRRRRPRQVLRIRVRRTGRRLAVGPEGDTYLLRCIGGCGSRTVVTRFLPDGTIDRSYGEGGTTPAIAGLESNTGSEAAIAIDAEGRVVVAAVLRQGLVLTRLNLDGSVDHSFSGGGIEGRIECGCVGLRMMIDSAGRIVVDGRSTVTDNGETQYALPSTSTLFFLRILGDGRADPSFGENGRTIVTLEGVFTPQASIVQSDGGIVIAGSKRLRGITPFALRIEPSGSFQRLYGAALMQGPLSARLQATGVTALIGRPNGVRVLGQTESGGYVLALGAQGKVSHSFGQGGFRLLPWKVGSAVADREGRIVGVSAPSYNSNVDAFRLLANGAPDRTFAGGRGVLLLAASEMQSAASEQVVMPPNQRPTFVVSTIDFCRFGCSAEQTLFRLRGGNSARSLPRQGRDGRRHRGGRQARRDAPARRDRRPRRRRRGLRSRRQRPDLRRARPGPAPRWSRA